MLSWNSEIYLAARKQVDAEQNREGPIFHITNDLFYIVLTANSVDIKSDEKKSPPNPPPGEAYPVNQ